ncbi:MAG: type II toxin-antitoxin system antitoxin, RelB/DinJ family, partial [Veillonellaceae bacterium]|nr:type II toxin-antitoxin system antitoxin, RelB/DinJ family [Veillonellaceae bacterium]
MTIRMDPEIKKESQELFRSLGLDMTTAINLFLRQSLMHRGLP